MQNVNCFFSVDTLGQHPTSCEYVVLCFNIPRVHINPSSEEWCFTFSSLLLLFPFVFVKQLTEKQYAVDGSFLLKVYVNVPLGIVQFASCQMESVFSAAARNH